jgi:tRNA modification GTPase
LHDFAVSSRTGQGVDTLRAALLPAILGLTADAEAIVSSARQRDVLLAVARAAESAAASLVGAGGPAVAVTELAAALRHVDALAGRDTTEDVLDRLFSRFCVGK